MEKLKNKIEKYINKTGVIKTPAYFIKELLISIIDYIKNFKSELDTNISSLHMLNDNYVIIKLVKNTSINHIHNFSNHWLSEVDYAISNNNYIHEKDLGKPLSGYIFVKLKQMTSTHLFFSSNIEEVYVPLVMTEIPEGFFSGPHKYVVIHDYVTRIEKDGLGISSQDSFFIPKNVSYLGDSAIIAKEEYIVDENNANYMSYNNCVYSKDGSSLILVPSNIKTLNLLYNIPDINALILNSYIYSQLENIITPDDALYYKAINGILYDKDVTKLIYYPNNYQGNFEIPESVTDIERNALDCYNKADLIFPENISNIKDIQSPNVHTIKVLNKTLEYFKLFAYQSIFVYFEGDVDMISIRFSRKTTVDLSNSTKVPNVDKYGLQDLEGNIIIVPDNLYNDYLTIWGENDNVAMDEIQIVKKSEYSKL